MNRYRWSDLRVGLSHAFEAVVTDAMMQRFMEDSGDTNPLHADAEFARRHGFAGPVVHGLLSSAFYSRLVGVYLPGEFAVLHGIQVDFHAPVYTNVVLRVEGEITYLNDAFQRAEVRAAVLSPAGEALSKAKIRVGLHA